MEVVNVKVAHIRPAYANLKEWMRDPKNVYIGRKGVVFVDKVRFPPHDSIWANPFKITSQCSREESITRYEVYIRSKINNGEITAEEVASLAGKRLGCWCAPEPCHGNVLVKIVAEMTSNAT
ncbi:hypothetical protein BGW41_003272 [Actinomortierella wolfii]|nr:hypothetical protein BGW41_003272 [Actinomortierella wolfii]